VIRRFRDMGMPVADARSVLLADVEERGALITAHLGRLEEQLAATHAAVAGLSRLLAPGPVGHRGPVVVAHRDRLAGRLDHTVIAVRALGRRPQRRWASAG